MITSGNVDNAALGFLVATLAPIPKNLAGSLSGLVATFLPALTEIFPKLSKKLPNPSAFIVLSLTVRDVFCYKLNKNRLVIYYF